MSSKPATQEDNIIVAFIVMVVGAILIIFLAAQCGGQSDMARQLGILQDDIKALKEDVLRDIEFLESDLKTYYRLMRDLILGLF